LEDLLERILVAQETLSVTSEQSAQKETNAPIANEEGVSE